MKAIDPRFKILNHRLFISKKTYVQNTDQFDNCQYSCHSFSHPGDRVTGGSSFLVKQGIIHSPLNNNLQIQTVAVRLTLNIVFILCSLYRFPSSTVCQWDLQTVWSAPEAWFMHLQRCIYILPQEHTLDISLPDSNILREFEWPVKITFVKVTIIHQYLQPRIPKSSANNT